MATLVLPTRTDDAIYRMKVDLEGETYTLDFQFNSREGAWYFDLLDDDEVVIRSGIKVVTGFPLLRLIHDSRRPAGEMLAEDSSGTDAEAGLKDLGGDVLLVYAEAADVAQAIADAD